MQNLCPVRDADKDPATDAPLARRLRLPGAFRSGGPVRVDLSGSPASPDPAGPLGRVPPELAYRTQGMKRANASCHPITPAPAWEGERGSEPFVGLGALAMALTRRQLFQASAATGAVLVLSAGRSRRPVRAPLDLKRAEELRVPPFVDGASDLELDLVNATHQFHATLPASDTLAYRLRGGTNGYLGPTIVVPTGRPLTIRSRNSIRAHPLAAAAGAGKPPAATHLHGGNSRPDEDGRPYDTFLRERTFVYDNDQDAAGLWYHDQALGMTRFNVYAGLAAAYLVRDIAVTGIDTGHGEFLPPPPYEIPLILQDKTLGADGQLSYPTAWAPEFFGSSAIVNGTVHPFLGVKRGVYRFRIYNGANARFFRLGLEVRHSGRRLPFLQIGTDGGLLNAPVPLTRLLLAPGERADLLVDFREVPAGTVMELTNDAPTPFPYGPHPGHRGGPPLRSAMTLQVSSGSGWKPTQVRALERMNLRPITPVRRLDKAARKAKVRSHSILENVGVLGLSTVVNLDNRSFESEDYKRTPVRLDSVEVWEFANTTRNTHPIHLHLVQFQVLNRQRFDVAGYLWDYGGSQVVIPDMPPYPAPSARPYLLGRVQPPAAQEMGWKDTVQAPPGMVTRIVVPFGRGAVDTPVAARNVHRGDYVWSSQILEQQDAGMLQRYRIA